MTANHHPVPWHAQAVRRPGPTVGDLLAYYRAEALPSLAPNTIYQRTGSC